MWAYDQLDAYPEQSKRELYRRVSEILGRSENAVAYKIQNVASFDHRPRERKPVSEATHAQALLGEVFEHYWEDRGRARDLFAVQLQRLQFGIVDEEDQIISTLAPEKMRSLIIEEGTRDLLAVHRRRRSRMLLERGRSYFRKLDPEGRLRCEACGFVTPKKISAEIVQLHHTEPLYDFGKQGKLLKLSEALSKLVPLCPTCHQIAHIERPPLSIQAIKELRASRFSDHSLK